jgi:Arylsulfotransferase (ASST)
VGAATQRRRAVVTSPGVTLQSLIPRAHRAAVPKPWPTPLAAAALCLVVAVVPACAGDDESSSDRGDDTSTTTTTAGSSGRAPEGSGESIEHVPLRAYATRPDLRPPVIDVETAASPTPGFVFLTPKRAGAQASPLIVDDEGETVWSAPTAGHDVAADLRVQTYEGEPVLTWWEGRSAVALGFGEAVIVDRHYREVARVQTGNGLEADFHEFRLTDEGTALLVAYRAGPADLSAVGGPEEGYEFENYVQEVDIATGEVLMEWRASDHVPMTDTFSELTEDADGSEDAPFDWFHVNSVAPGPDGTLLVSARNTHAIYAIDRVSGALRWSLGGRSSDVAMGEGVSFMWQHDAQWLGGSRISLFDNHASLTGGDASRALILDVDTQAMTAELVAEARHPDGVSAGTQGNTQLLGDGRLFVGWGSEGRVTEFSAAGDVVFDASFAPADSYRAYRFEWTGLPEEHPDVVVTPASDPRDDRGADDGGGDDGGDEDGGDDASPADEEGGLDVAVSWNGATEVASWRVLAGDDTDDLEPVATVRREGFETAIRIPIAGVVEVEALDASGAVLDRSDTIVVER